MTNELSAVDDTFSCSLPARSVPPTINTLTNPCTSASVVVMVAVNVVALFDVKVATRLSINTVGSDRNVSLAVNVTVSLSPTVAREELMLLLDDNRT